MKEWRPIYALSNADRLEHAGLPAGSKLLGHADAWEGSINSVSYYEAPDGKLYRRLSVTQSEWTGKLASELDKSALINWRAAP